MAMSAQFTPIQVARCRPIAVKLNVHIALYCLAGPCWYSTHGCLKNVCLQGSLANRRL